MLESYFRPIQRDDASGNGWLDKYIKEYGRDPDYVAEGLALLLIEQAIRIMTEKGISRSDLASLIGVSRAYVTRLFKAPPNLTLRSVAQLAIALDAKPVVSLTLPSAAVKGESVAATVEYGLGVNMSAGPVRRAIAPVDQAVRHADETGTLYEAVWGIRDISTKERPGGRRIANAA